MGCYVQYGCGLCAPKEWINFDSSPRLRLEQLPGASLVGQRLFPTNIRFGDIVRGLPVGDGIADGVYCSHVLEHIARDDLKISLANTLRIMKPGAVFRLVVPDLEWRLNSYSDRGADYVIDKLNICRRQRPRGAVALLRTAFGNSGHRWMYDWKLMEQVLRDAGFVDIRKCAMHDSGNPMFDLVEADYQFFDDGPELAVEARKS